MEIHISIFEHEKIESVCLTVLSKKSVDPKRRAVQEIVNDLKYTIFKLI